MRPYPSLTLFIFLLFVGLASSSYVSNHALEPSVPTGRKILQATTACTINFEDQNYTIITSQCKGPIYSPKLCCDAFKQFSCPIGVELNDMKSDCATTMFSYINLYGKYPPGIFSNMCKESSQGLECEEVNKSQKSGALRTSQSTLLVLSAGFLMLLYNNVF